MKRILILILVFVLTASFPCVVMASSVDSDLYDVDIVYQDFYTCSIWASGFTQGNSKDLRLGEDYSVTLSSTNRSIIRPTFHLGSLLEPYRVLLKNASNVYFSAYFNGVVDSGGVFSSGGYAIYYEPKYGNQFFLSGGDFVDGFLNGELRLDSINLGRAFSDDWNIFDVFIDFDTEFRDYQEASPLLEVRSFRIIFYLTGIDGQSYDQFLVITNNLNNIDTSVKQVASEVKVMQSQLNNIQSDINSGFNEVGGKLDSMLTPDSNNQQAVDQMGGQVDYNKQEAEDIKNQIDSLDKPDPDDLIDQIDPDQFIDNDDEAVQEMTGILASVTGSKVVKNYLLLLICIGIVSFVVYGKKGG